MLGHGGILLRAGEVAEFGAGGGTIGVGVGVTGVVFDGEGVVFFRLLPFAETHVRIAPSVISDGEIGLSGDGLGEHFDGLAEIASLVQLAGKKVEIVRRETMGGIGGRSREFCWQWRLFGHYGWCGHGRRWWNWGEGCGIWRCGLWCFCRLLFGQRLNCRKK